MSQRRRTPRASAWLCAIGVMLCLATATRVGAASEGELELQRAQSAMTRGGFEQAAQHFANAAERFAKEGDATARRRALLRLAEAQQALGAHRAAVRTLETLLAADGAEQTGEAAVRSALGRAWLALGEPQRAEPELERAAALSEAGGDARLASAVANDLATLRALGADYEGAAGAFRRSAELAPAGAEIAAARALGNAARAELHAGDAAAAAATSARAYQRLQAGDRSAARATVTLQLALLHLELSRRGEATPEQRAAERLRAQALLAEAQALGSELGDARTLSYALGYQGALYEDAGRRDEALHLTDRAIWQAEQTGLADAAYRWYWRRGRLLEASGRRHAAIDAYQAAIDIVQANRTQLTEGERAAGRSFRERVGGVYLDLVDLLLRDAAAASQPEAAEALRRRARDIVELQKAAELRDHFRDECVDALQARTKGVSEVSASAAVIYPIALEDRLELLLMAGAQPIAQVTVPVGAAALREQTEDLRRHLEEAVTRRYLREARQLYAWLIAPLEAQLPEGVDTLVFVPGGVLRTVPLAALHDGERFLVERFAVAVTPGLSLTDPRPIQRDALVGLFAGLSESVEGFPPLDHVTTEIESIREVVGGDVLLNESFRLDSVQGRLETRDYRVVHIATHAQFEPDFSETFLLTYDGKLSGDRFGDALAQLRFQDEPIDLLTLSACDTGRGDERSALGLAGIAVRAGARSAIGTLWTVDDEATAILMAEFYRQLVDEHASRAIALQRAQLLLLRDLRYKHPRFWSPFLMINNWL